MAAFAHRRRAYDERATPAFEKENLLDRKSERPKKAKSPANKTKSLPHKVLLIEDDDSYAQLLAYALEQESHCDVTIAADSFEAANQMSLHPFDLIITDWKLPPFTGFASLRKADQTLALDPMAPSEWFLHKKTPVIVVTVCDADEVGREKKLKGRFQFLGVVSKGQPVEGVIDQVRTLYGNFPLAATG
jgi:CheY-like chemotaxis protein